MSATLSVTAGTVLHVNGDRADTSNSAGSFGGRGADTDPAGNGGASDARTMASNGTYPPADRRGASLAERGHVHARFGGIPVLVTAEMAAQIKAFREKQP